MGNLFIVCNNVVHREKIVSIIKSKGYKIKSSSVISKKEKLILIIDTSGHTGFYSIGLLDTLRSFEFEDYREIKIKELTNYN